MNSLVFFSHLCQSAAFWITQISWTSAMHTYCYKWENKLFCSDNVIGDKLSTINLHVVISKMIRVVYINLKLLVTTKDTQDLRLKTYLSKCLYSSSQVIFLFFVLFLNFSICLQSTDVLILSF